MASRILEHNKLQLVGWIAVFLGCTACHRTAPQVPANRPDEHTTQQQLLGMNLQYRAEELQEIQAYLDTMTSYPWQETEDGYWKYTVAAGYGDTLQHGQQVALAYSLELLEGVVCQSSADGQPLILEIGRRQKLKGLDLALTTMQTGEEAVLLLPSHLAYGTQGSDCVTPRTPILLRIKILEAQ